MSIKLIATDLDGTLMSTDHLTVTPYTVETLKKAHNKGVKIAIATGRPLALIDSVTEQIPFADYVIYSNGACVFDRNDNKNIYRDLIENNTALEIIKYFLTKKVFFEIYVDGKSHYQLGTEEYFDSTAFPKDFIDEVYSTMTAHEDIIAFLGDNGIEKITLYGVKNEDMDTFEKQMQDLNLTVASSFIGNLEATSKTANKGTAVKGLCDILGITSDNVMSFGDAGNDIQMLQFSKYSFAMGNATDECKKSAKYIAKSNGEDGLAKAVEEFVLA
jgi:hypothetical protein